MFNWLKRLRSSRGFGIHSPFAYDFVVNVLRERCLYYAYSNIENLEHQLIYRIALSLHPSCVICRNLPETVRRDISSLISNAKYMPFYVFSHGEDFQITTEGTYIALFTGIDKDRTLRELLKRLKDELDSYGMVFYNPRRAVIEADTNLPRQDFRINF
ncbi:MAG: hypothetical protein K2G95_06855 [Muribaculaceae bacterium]|nr:hypothetical protein [Muribaculaceae bacterium]